MKNKELAKLIISCFEWWEIDNPQENYKITLKSLKENNKKDLQTMANYFKENIMGDFQVVKSTKILNEINKRLGVYNEERTVL